MSAHPARLQRILNVSKDGYSLTLFIRKSKKNEILRQLIAHDFNVKQTATTLRMSRVTLYRVMRTLKIVKPHRAASRLACLLEKIRADANHATPTDLLPP
jgi:DNA-binding NtrC family response regulator